MKKIYDGDVKARVDAAIENYHSYVSSNIGDRVLGIKDIDKLPPELHPYYSFEFEGYAQEVKDIAKLYKKSGWKAVAELIKQVNEQCWKKYSLGFENVSKFYGELYHAACAWYQGYPANAEEQKNANPEDGSFEHVSEDDMCKIYKYLD